MKPNHGLVIGKFYPPHQGHHLLVRTAASMCERVSVVVMASKIESIPLEVRVSWMKKVHQTEHNVQVAGIYDENPVNFHDDAIWRAHVTLMLEGARKVNVAPIDAVFTSEVYGNELGERIGVPHISVDPSRELVPVSATRVRREPAIAWEYLAAPVREGLAQRVVIVGAESTGKTTLAIHLAEQLRKKGGSFGITRSVEEYGREYTVEFLARERARAQLQCQPVPSIESLVWPSKCFEQIAAEQNRREDMEARVGGPILICDTDAFATGIWHERYVGSRSNTVESLARKHSLYLLTHWEDVSFVQDGLRDGEKIRQWMTNAFAQRLTATGRQWQWIRGSQEIRMEAALLAIQSLLDQGRGFAEPLG